MKWLWIVGATALWATLVYAQVPMTGAGPGTPQASSGGAPAPPVVDTFDPARLVGGAGLSGGNLVANGGSVTATPSFAVSINSHASGKYYWELTVNTNVVASYTLNAGISNTNVLSSLTTGIGNNTLTAGMFGNTVDGKFYQNNNMSTATGLTYGTVNDNLGVALDIGNNAIWYRVNGGNWNGNVSNNPSTNVGGISITPTNVPGTLWVAVQVGITPNNGAVTINFGTSAFAFTTPSGFSNF